MLKKTIEFTDFNGNTRKEDFYFNLTQAEVTEMELSVEGGIVEMINRIVAAQNGKQIVAVLKDMILRAYGVKSPDGRRFIKNDEVREDFAQTEAFSKLFMELATNADAASDFFRGIIPADIEGTAKESASSAALTALPPA